ncbi:MAG: hypothetical protein ACYTDE_04975, partial [Planctomycetota bacterium]
MPSFPYHAISMFTVWTTWSVPTAIDGSGGRHGVWTMPGNGVIVVARARAVTPPATRSFAGVRGIVLSRWCLGRTLAGRISGPRNGGRAAICGSKRRLSTRKASADPIAVVRPSSNRIAGGS